MIGTIRDARQQTMNAIATTIPCSPSLRPEVRYLPMAQTASRTTDIYAIAGRLWETADKLRANSHLNAAEYSIPVLGLIYLKFADSRFTQMKAELASKITGRRQIGKADYAKRLHS